jgi:hypothetical protein
METKLRDYYEAVLATMATPGWALLMEDFQDMRDQASNITNIKTLERLYFTQGELSIIDLILGRRWVTRQAFDHLEKTEAMEADNEEDL